VVRIFQEGGEVITGSAGLQLIKSCEDLRTMAYAATENERERGIWSIGYGSTHGVKEGDTCTEAEAEAMLKKDLEIAEDGVMSMVEVPLNQNEFDALVSFTFNVGTGSLESSTLLRRLNAGLRNQAAEQFERWNKQQGVILPGLTKRRALERALFLRPV
jgi:lysozyme